MHSKILPWDFVSKFPQTINSAKTGVYAFLSSDPYIEHILSKNLPRKNLSFRCYTGLDITKDYIEEHFCNLSFFSQTENIFIMNAELMSANNYPLLLEKIPEISNQYIVLFFSKTNKLFLELQKIVNVETFTIEAPRFWEGPKMLQFAAKEKKVNLKNLFFLFFLLLYCLKYWNDDDDNVDDDDDDD